MRKQELIIFVAVIILVAIVFLSYVFFSLFSGAPAPTASPSPTVLKSPLPTRALEFSPLPILTSPLPSSSTQLIKDQVTNSLPIRTPLFNIEYYYDGNLFKVTIKEDPYAENKVQAEEWFRERGLNIKDLNIYWDAYPEVQR